MSFSNLLIRNSLSNGIRSVGPVLVVSRQGHTVRGKPPGVAKTIEQRLQEESAVSDAKLFERVNIGFPRLRPSRSQQLKERLAHLKVQRASSDMEKLARSNKLVIDMEQVQKDYRNTTGHFDVRTIADHYRIYDDLFGCAYFVPRIPLDIKYEIDADTQSPVYNGNIIKPSAAAKEPIVTFDGFTDPITGNKSKDISYWTLLATNPDGNLSDTNSECVHWFISNIPNGDVKKGDCIVDYLQPFPPKGIGYQRFVFVLYKQNAKLDFNSYKIDKSDSNNLLKRQFKTLDFYRKYQDDITPAGLSFFQTNWDKSITDFYHNVLNIKEPIYEYDFPDAYLADQKFFPLKQPFNLYMDKHRDPKLVNQAYLERKLAATHPFEGPTPPMRFPNAHPIRGVPSWLKTEIRKQRLGIGRVNDI